MAASLVSESRFKLIDVPRRVSIREFTTSHGLDFAAGKGFYELMKPEVIQDYKEIVAVRRTDGSKVTGAKVRELLGIPASAAKFRLDAEKLSDFKVFVQSTSYNRVLVPGTQFLYEVGDGSSGESGSSMTHDRPPAPPCGAGMPIEIVLSFDTTGSMSSVLTIVRERLQELIERLHRDIPGIRMAVFAHGDYCDKSSSYITKYVDFTTDAGALRDFVRNVSSTGGGDWEECYELVLKEAREKLSWTPGTQRALVMIGDAVPHEPADYKSDSILKKFPRVVWKDEVDALARQTGCRVYAVQCLDNSRASNFWKYMAYHTHGYHLNLTNFSSVLDFIMAICYREQGAEQLQAYRAEVEERTRAEGGMNAELHRLFEALGVPMAGTAAPTDSPAPATTASRAASTPTAEEAGSAAAAGSRSAGRKRKADVAKPSTGAAAKRARTAAVAKKATSPATPRRGGAAKRGAAAAVRPAAASAKKKGARKAPAKAAGRRAAGAAKDKAKNVKAKVAAPKAKPTAGARRPAPSKASRGASAGASAADKKKKEPPKRNPKKK